MKSFFLPLCLSLVMGVTLSSCKKDKKEDPAPTETNTQKLTGKNWNLRSYTVSPGYDFFGTGTLITDIYAQYQSTDKDDIERFDTPSVYKYDEGPTKAPGAVQTVVGTWTFSSDEKQITITAPTGGTPESYEIVELTSTSLKLKQVETDPGTGINYTFEKSYVKQ